MEYKETDDEVESDQEDDVVIESEREEDDLYENDENFSYIIFVLKINQIFKTHP